MSSKSFIVKIEYETTMSIEQIWPDGDAPENPTAKDVVKAMQEDCPTVAGLLSEWDFPVTVRVTDEINPGDQATWED